MSNSDGATPVTIYGRTYHLRGAGDPRHLGEIAGEVDRRMREVADASGAADTAKVAILAALNIADDCVRARRSTFTEAHAERLGHMVARIDEVLDDPGCRPTGDPRVRAE